MSIQLLTTQLSRFVFVTVELLRWLALQYSSEGKNLKFDTTSTVGLHVEGWKSRRSRFLSTNSPTRR
jgi:hypothetical protein